MAMAARLSARLGAIDESVVERLCALLQRARLPVSAPRLGAERYLDLMGRDKKVVGGALRFVLLDRLGAARLRADVTDADLAAMLPH
jgi:3-dehydroquinate synthase